MWQRNPSNTQWREFTHTATEAYLAKDFDPAAPPAVRELAASAGFTQPTPGALLKCERYAVAAAGIAVISAALIKGAGAGAQFARPLATYRPRVNDPVIQLANDIGQTFRNTSATLLRNPRSRLGFFMDRFEFFTKQHRGAVAFSREFILSGGDLPTELADQLPALRQAIENNPRQHRLDQRGREAIYHANVYLSTGRASHHIRRFHDLPEWPDIARDIVITDRGHARHKNGSQLFRTSSDQIISLEPTLKCPAHHHFSGRKYTDLENGLHAGIHEAARRGLL